MSAYYANWFKAETKKVQKMKYWMLLYAEFSAYLDKRWTDHFESDLFRRACTCFKTIIRKKAAHDIEQFELGVYN